MVSKRGKKYCIAATSANKKGYLKTYDEGRKVDFTSSKRDALKFDSEDYVQGVIDDLCTFAPFMVYTYECV